MIEIDIPYQPIIRALRELMGNLSDRRELMRDLSGIMHRAVEDNFASEGRPKWVALSPMTISMRRKSGTWPGQILQASGQLAASVQPYSDNDQALVGTNKVYAAIQQYGGVIKPKTKRALRFGGVVVRQVTIPARPFLHLTAEDSQDLLDEAQHFLQAQIQKL